ncbi:SGNH/GDSL hydrolase family protein [Weissella paramesenteroides]|uniref:SGNH/GDSL hydrolase family protein n=1 Tax=Weissella paramesenteroides TaxID=1249 RepID=A0ABD4XGR0_WEIPA|nr:SGNH/GDSL hydrolase family protein [Weissella paramesenteroides]MDF8368317.1 SGNH/GDSL hydrolase family protein [Weissella paramesenteroides]MDF8370494.1 SGNH/GDSL hydrolase family protein [Weissella paramesenteroides]
MTDTQAVTYNDPLPNNFPNDYDAIDIDARTLLRTSSIRTKMYGKDVREAIAEGIEINATIANEALEATDIASNTFKDEYTYNGNWEDGYVASSNNTSNYPEGQITNSTGVNQYKHSNYIGVVKGDLVLVKMATFDGIIGLAKFDGDRNFVSAIQQDRTPLTDFAYIVQENIEYLMVSNASATFKNPSIHVIKNYENDYTKKMNDLSAASYNGYINPTTHEIVGSGSYRISNMIPIREKDLLFLKLWNSTGAAAIVEMNANGTVLKNIAVGENKLKYYNVAGITDEIRFIRYVNRVDFNDVTASLTTNLNTLFKKKVGMLGDSYVKGNKTDENLTAYNIASLKLGASYINYGINGNTIASYDGYADNQVPMSIRFADMDDNLDIIGFEGGRNDYNHNIPIGEDTDTDVTTFKGALNVLCEGLIKKYLGKKLFGVPCWAVNTSANSVGATQLDYLNAFVHIVHDIWGIEILDSRSVGVFMNSPEFLAKYTEDGNSISHLNADGHAMFANKVEDFLNNI